MDCRACWWRGPLGARRTWPPASSSTSSVPVLSPSGYRPLSGESCMIKRVFMIDRASPIFCFCFFVAFWHFCGSFFVAFLLRSLSIATVHLHVSASIFIIECTKTKDPASKILIFQSGQYKLLIKSFYMIFFHAHVFFFFVRNLLFVYKRIRPTSYVAKSVPAYKTINIGSRDSLFKKKIISAFLVCNEVGPFVCLHYQP